MIDSESRITIHHILVRNAELAAELHRELINGADFSAIVMEYSVCPSKARQGHCGSLSVSTLPSALLPALATDQQDEFPPPVKTGFGYHLLKITERLPRPVLND